MNPITTAINGLKGGQAAMARLLGVRPQAVNQWAKGRRPVPARHVLAIEAATGISRHALRPDVFGTTGGTLPPAQRQAASGTGALVDSRMNKRALRARLGMSSDAHLATVLGLTVEQVSSWTDEDMVSALPQVMRLLGVEEEGPAQNPPEDPDEGRYAPLEVA